MRPWEREQESPLPEDSPPRRLTRGSLSSMVVRLPENEVEVDRDDGGGGEVENAEERQLERRNDLDESPTSPKTRLGQSQRLADGSGFNLPTRNEYYKEKSRGRNVGDRLADYSPKHGPDRGPGFNHSTRNGYYKEQFRGRNAGDRLADYSPKHGPGRGPGNPRDFSPRHEHNRVGGRFAMLPIANWYGASGRMFGNNGCERSRGRLHDFSDNCRQGGSRERFRDISPLYEHKRNWRTFHDDPPPPKQERLGGRSHDPLPALERDRSGGRINNFSLTYGHESDAQFLQRDFKRPSTGILPSKDVAPKSGDWLCENPSCGNLNFAQREYCYNCHSHCYEGGDDKLRGSPGRGSSLEKLSPPVDQWRGKISHRPPPHTWTRKLRQGFPITCHGQSLPDTPSQRGRANYDDDVRYRANNKFDIRLTRDHNSRKLEAVRYDFGHGRKGGPHREFWIQDFRQRSRSPRRDRPPLRYSGGLFTGRGQGHGHDCSGRRKGALVDVTP